MPNYGNIFIGWFNKGLDGFNLLDRELKQLSDKRIGVCTNCQVRTKNKCDKKKADKAVKDLIYEDEKVIAGQIYPGCGCFLDAKTLVIDELCPLGKW